MKHLASGALAVMLMGIVACSESTGVSVDDLAGTWSATQFLFTNPANAAQTYDMIAAGGSLSLTVQPNGDYSATMTVPGNAPEAFTGTISVEGDILTLAESGHGSPTPYNASRSGNTLTLTTDDELFDFDEDGTEELASLRLVLVRQ